MIVAYDGSPCYVISAECPAEYSYWRYRPSFGINTSFLILFGISFLAFVIQGTRDATWLAFTIAIAAGCALEVAGYAGRILAHQDMFAETPFLTQIICLTIGPAFLAAGIYLCLSRIVTTIGQEHSRIRPLSYPKIFIPCDIISLVLQAIGGGMSSVAIHKKKSTHTGDRIMIAGLAFQVATMLIFILISADFAWRAFRNHKALAPPVPTLGQTNTKSSWSFKAFLVALALSTLCVFTRCVFRVAELSEGWKGHLASTQKYFIGLEGAVVVASVLLLNLCHPAFCFKHAKDARPVQSSKKSWFGKRKSDPNTGEENDAERAATAAGPPNGGEK